MQLHISNDPPISRAFLKAASIEIGNILQSYIAIHDDLFRVSFSRIFYESINFDDYFRRLYYLTDTLDRIVRQFPEYSDEVPELLLVIKRYCEALRAAMSGLRKICGSLMAKASHQEEYQWTVYQSDLAKYKATVSRYQEIGKRMNLLLND